MNKNAGMQRGGGVGAGGGRGNSLGSPPPIGPGELGPPTLGSGDTGGEPTPMPTRSPAPSPPLYPGHPYNLADNTLPGKKAAVRAGLAGMTPPGGTY